MSNLAFFGTPDFAATIFEGLVHYCKAKGHTIQFAVCQPDKKKGRNQIVEPSKVKSIAIENDIEIFQPNTLKANSQEGDAFFEKIKSIPLDLAIVVAYGKLLPNRILALPRCGFVNVHASLLPRWRGASPIHHAILAGDQETGVSIMDVVTQMDAGDVYLSRAISIDNNDTTASLTKKLAQLGLASLLSSIEGIISGELPKFPQKNDDATFAPKLKKEDGIIPWNSPAKEILQHARAMHPWPESFTFLGSRSLKLFQPQISQFELGSGTAVVGEIVHIDESIHVRCKDAVLSFSEIQMEGKRRMNIRDAKNGKVVKVGDKFTNHPTPV